MTWQEYQEAVANLYEEAEGLGKVERNVMIPDRITGQNRQVDALLSLETKGHSLKILIDAKFHSAPIDVKEVEGVAALANAVGACKSIIVALNGWTEPAAVKSQHLSCDLRILTLEQALEQLVPDMWMVCPSCERDCIVMDQSGYIQFHYGGIVWWLAGACRECGYLMIWCQDCGGQFGLAKEEEVTCNCGYQWMNNNGIGKVAFPEEEEKS